jgi:hypothetical protein
LPLTGGGLTGNLTTTGLIDGRDVAADGTKLDGIEASADVTDTTNVVAALTAGTGITIAGNGTIASTASSDLVDDTTPQLGGDLQSNGNDIVFADNDKAIFGAGSDLQIYHDGSNSYIDDAGTGKLFTRSSQFQVQKYTGENMIVAVADDRVDLYYNNSKKLATTSTGVDVTGTVTADGLTVDVNNAGITMTDSSSTAFEAIKTTTSDALQFSSGGSGSFMNFYTNAGNERMRLTSAGSLGLGTTTPSQKAHIYGGSLLIDNGSSAGTIYFHDTTNYINLSGDELQFANNGSERMRIDSSGNVGIGVSSMTNKLVLPNAAYFAMQDTGGAESLAIRANSSNAMEFLTGGGLRQTIDSSGNLLVGKTSVDYTTVGFEATPSSSFQANAMTADGKKALLLARKTTDGGIVEFRKDSIVAGSIGSFDSGANIYIGSGDTGVTFNPTVNGILPHNPSTNSQLDNAIDLGYPTYRFKHGYFANTVYTASVAGITDNDTYINFANNNIMQFITGGSERGRFNSAGNLLLGQSSTDTPGTGNTTTGTSLRGLGDGFFSRSNGEALYLNRNNDGGMISIRRSNSQVGVISVTTSGTTYNTTSDIRLKQDIEPLVATDKLMQMNPVSYAWKSNPDGPRSMGFIAQEMQEVMPEAVSTGDDDDAMMSMDYGRITPILVSALQDAHKKIEQLEQRLADMEAN